METLKTILNYIKIIIDSLKPVFKFITGHISWKNFGIYMFGVVTAVSTELILFNWNGIYESLAERINTAQVEYHEQKMENRDQLMTNLNPLLTEFRADTEADRVLYFEFHNSIENLDGVPFKFFDLMLSPIKYGVPGILATSYKNIGASIFTPLFDLIKSGKIVYCEGPKDSEFRETFPGFFELFNTTDHSNRLVIFSIPGVNQMIGFIVLEWMEDEEIPEENLKKLQHTIHSYVPRINTLAVTSQYRNI